MSKLDDIEMTLSQVHAAAMKMVQHFGPMQDMVTDLSNNTNKRALSTAEMRKLLDTVIAIIERGDFDVEIVRDIRELTYLSIPTAVELVKEFTGKLDKVLKVKMAKIRGKEAA